MTRSGLLPDGDERHDKAIAAAVQPLVDSENEHRYEGGPYTSPMVEPHEYGTEDFLDLAEPIVAAYHRSLAEQGARFVDASEVAEWLDDQCGSARMHAFLRRFVGGDEVVASRRKEAP